MNKMAGKEVILKVRWLPRIKAVKKKKTMVITLVLALAMIAVCSARCYSYLTSVRSADFEVSTASKNVLRLSGSFDLEKWVSSGETGYYLTNFGDEDLWVYFEYTGELGQVFSAAVPLLVPRQGGEQPNTVSLKLAPLDEISAPRVLNPQDVFTSEDGSKEFSGTIRVYTLNKYVALETERISVPGEALWRVMMAKKFAAPNGARTADAIGPHSDAEESLKGADENLSESGDLVEKALQVVADDEKYLTLVKERKRITLKDRVVFIVETVAPGLMGEHQFLTEATDGLLKRFERLNQIVKQLAQDRDTLQQTVNAQAQTIQALENENASLTQQVKELQERLSALTAALSNSSPETHEGSPASDGEPAEPKKTDAETEAPALIQEPAAAEQGSSTLDAGIEAEKDVPAALSSAED